MKPQKQKPGERSQDEVEERPCLTRIMQTV
jgi:hypothetical protein